VNTDALSRAHSSSPSRVFSCSFKLARIFPWCCGEVFFGRFGKSFSEGFFGGPTARRFLSILACLLTAAGLPPFRSEGLNRCYGALRSFSPPKPLFCHRSLFSRSPAPLLSRLPFHRLRQVQRHRVAVQEGLLPHGCRRTHRTVPPQEGRSPRSRSLPRFGLSVSTPHQRIRQAVVENR